MPETTSNTENAAAGDGRPEPYKEGDQLYGMGYDLYPRRKEAKKMEWKNIFFGNPAREDVIRYKCERRVVDVIKNSVLVRVMISALEKSGCPISFKRHISCEYCEPYVTGGYDALTNQVVICSNTTKNYGITELVLFHELIHMFDYCTNHVDFRNIEHLACTEVRAANLTYCNYFSAYLGGLVSRTSLKKQHKACVFKKAMWSVTAARNVSYEEAEAAVQKVFKKCYKDLEPIGRQMRRSTKNADLAYSEAFLMGFD